MTPTSGQSDYGDPYDVMSCLGCFAAAPSYQGAGGPGLNVVQLESAGWLPADRGFRSFDNSSCRQTTIPMAALNHPEASGYLEARIPASVPIQFGTPMRIDTSSDYYTVELRSQSGWDVGIPEDVAVLHLHGRDGYSYIVDTDGVIGTYSTPFPAVRGGAGSAYVDTARNAYVAVNTIDPAQYSGTVTLASCQIKVDVTYAGATTGDYSDRVTLAADVRVRGSSAPVPYRPVTLSLGTQSCTAEADRQGRATCVVVIDQHPGAVTAGAQFLGDAAYEPASSTPVTFTINKEQTEVAYTGATTSDYHDAFEASAVLTEPDGPVAGKTLGFALGAADTDTCSATTDAAGRAACTIVPTQAAGSVAVAASFAGDADYLGDSDSRAFEITRQETSATYTGPLVIMDGQPVTLSGRLVEEDGPVPVEGRALKLELGSLSCTGTTDASGSASCVISAVAVTLGPQPLRASFAGDGFFEPSADTTRQAIVFAFPAGPAGGAFVVGDGSAAAGGAVEWWSDEWASHNSLSGGAVPTSFKGFAGSTSTAPPSCGATWVSRPGNSPPPTSAVPSYMGVLVSSSIAKSGSEVSGDIVQILVVKTDAGYSPSPGHPGTGTIVATFCP